MSDDFRPKLRTFAERMVGLAPRCTNEESTKLFLILPFLNFLDTTIEIPTKFAQNTPLTSLRSLRTESIS